MHADWVDPEYDFAGWVLEKMPNWVVKAAKHGAVQSHIVTGKIWCINCKRPMWTCDPQREDTCDDCEYLLHMNLREMRQKRAVEENRTLNNPFAHGDDYIEHDEKLVLPVLRR